MTAPNASTSPDSKKPAPKTPAKKPAAKKPATSKVPPAKAATNEVFARWKAGARISELVKTFKLTRPQVRRQLLQGAGSREAFKALRKQGAGGTTEKTKKAVSK